MTQVIVTSTQHLSSTQKKTLVDGFAKKYGAIELTEVIDPHILGGLKVQVGSRLIDTSILNSVNSLQEVV